MRVRLLLFVGLLAGGCGITINGTSAGPGAGDAGPVPTGSNTTPIPVPKDGGELDDAAAVDPDGGTNLPDADIPDDDGGADAAPAPLTACGDVLYPEASAQAALNGHCYWVTTTAYTGGNVYKACMAHAGHPVNIDSNAENSVVYQLAKGKAADMFIGLRYTGFSSGWQWYANQASRYWRLYRGNGNDFNGGCAVMRQDGNGDWFTKTCQATLNVICETENP